MMSVSELCITGILAGSLAGPRTSTHSPSERRPGAWWSWRGAGGSTVTVTHHNITSQTFSENVVANIHKAVEEKQWQWGLRLCDMILDGQEEEELEEVRGLRSECLKELAAREVSAPGRNWYRTEDMVMAGLEIKPSKQARAARVMGSDMR